MTQDVLLGTREVADLLGVSPRTVHRRVTDGSLEAVHTAPGGPHGAYLFAPRHVEEYLEQRRPQARTP